MNAIAMLAVRTFLFLFVAATVCAEDWPQWRGPTGQGIATTQGLPLTWSEKENIAWKTELPARGWSSPVIWGDQIWLTAAEEVPDTKENIERRLKANTGGQPLNLAGEVLFRAICIDKNTGKLLHNVVLFSEKEPQWVHAMNSYASPSPVIEEGRFYCYFGTFGAACVDTTSGEVLWTNREHQIMHENGPGSSPVLFENELIFHCDGSDKQYITALDKNTGKTMWTTKRTGEMRSDPQLKKAYGTPLIVELGGKPVLISPASDWLYGYDPATGKELWKMNYGVLGFSIVPRPVTAHGMVYFCTSFMQSELLAVKCDSGVAPEIVWREKKSVPTMPSPLVVGEEIYMVSDNGGILTCLDAKSGKVHYRERIEGKHCASPLFADGRIYICDRDGATIVVKPGPKFEQLAKNTLESGIMASPAAVDGALFIRTEKALYRIQEKK